MMADNLMRIVRILQHRHLGRAALGGVGAARTKGTAGGPMPGSPKICSITTDPVTMPARAGPKKLTTGSIAGLRAWRVSTSRDGRPLARAVRTKLERSTSTILPLIIRAT